MNWGRFTIAPALLGLATSSLSFGAHANERSSNASGNQVIGDPADLNASDIVIVGRRDDGTISDITAENELNEADIAAYGQNSVGDLLNEIRANVDDSDDGPVVLINGRLANGLQDVSSLPTEAVSRIQLLPRELAARFGQRPDRQVINVVVKRQFRQAAVNAETGFATAGGGGIANGELSFTRLSGGDRTSVALRVRTIEPLLEADRAIAADPNIGTPYDLVGNVIPGALFGQEIDSALSALAGQQVSVAAVPPATPLPTLLDFVATANNANRSNLGTYRTLVARSRIYSLNASVARRLGSQTDFVLNVRGDLNRAESLTGSPSAILDLPSSSPFSPFSREVGIARYLGDALEQDRRGESLSAAATLNSMAGQWRLTLSGNFNHRATHTDTQRSIDLTALQGRIDAGLLNPFAVLPSDLLAIIRQDFARTTADSGNVQFLVSGSLLKLPAGAINTTLRIGAATDRSSNRSSLSGSVRSTGFRRDEVNGQFGVEVPLASRGANFLGALGELTIQFNASLRQATAVGTLWNDSFGFRWRPIERIALTSSISNDENPPSGLILSQPTIITSGVRVFDFLTNQTVSVTMIRGGNPAIPPEKRRTLRIGGIITPFANLDLDFVADYTKVRIRDAISALPPVSAAVQAAFADRYQRDAGGSLSVVDARAVTFARDDREQFRWGFTLKHHLGGEKQAGRRRQGGFPAADFANDDGEVATPSAPPMGNGLRRGVGGWRVMVSLFHTWTLRNARQARPSLPFIDMLDGGAAGYGGGQPRHSLEFDGKIAGHGIGFQADADWHSATVIRAAATPSVSDIHFAPHATVNMRVFADLGTILAKTGWAKGLRFSAAAINVFDSKQRVRDGNGTTPLRYQPYLLDPLGRTVSFSLRKAF